jgi:hypothetical protein
MSGGAEFPKKGDESGHRHTTPVNELDQGFCWTETVTFAHSTLYGRMPVIEFDSASYVKQVARKGIIASLKVSPVCSLFGVAASELEKKKFSVVISTRKEKGRSALPFVSERA